MECMDRINDVSLHNYPFLHSSHTNSLQYFVVDVVVVQTLRNVFRTVSTSFCFFFVFGFLGQRAKSFYWQLCNNVAIMVG